MDKQKRMLEDSDPGHFSMVRAMHLADLITLLNGTAQSIYLQSIHCTNATLQASAVSTQSCHPSATAWVTPMISATSGPLWPSCPLACSSTLWMARSLVGERRARLWARSSIRSLIWYATYHHSSYHRLLITTMQISFCVSPAVASIAIGMRTPLDHFLLTSFALCGLLRLARFNISTDSVPKDANGKAKYFEGLPTPTSLGIVALISYWVSQGWIHNQIPFGVIAQGSIFEFHPAALIFVAHGCLMISKTFHVPKP
jgi:CDP-diacylglycerol--serine O-phosphatidyltransferase